MISLQILAFLFSVLAAVVLAINNPAWSRTAALILSLGAAAVPAADQIFQISDMQRASYRSMADGSRLGAGAVVRVVRVMLFRDVATPG